MAVTSDTFLAAYPEFGNIGNSLLNVSSVITSELDFSVLLMNPKIGIDFRDRAISLLTAHRLAIRFKINLTSYGMKLIDKPGIITQQAAQTGGLNITATVSALVSGDNAYKADLSRTNYGLEFLSLIAVVVPPMGLV
jgi:hypothetical protein